MAMGLLAASLVMGACSSMRSAVGGNQSVWTLNSDPKLDAAQGQIVVMPKGDGNQEVTVKVKHLPPAEKVYGKQLYVVWLVPRGGGNPQNMGVLMPDKDLKASVEVHHAVQGFDIVVSAEETVDASSRAATGLRRQTFNLPT